MPLELDYYYGNEADQYSFYRIPKALFTDERFHPVSIEAKVLYGLLLDRMGLSIRSGWMDDDGRVYLYFILCRRFGVPCELPDVSRVAGLYDGWEPEERRSALDCIHDMSKQIGGSIEKSMEPKVHSRAPMKRPTR